MARLMKVPVLGIVENMAYFECPDCGKRHYIFGASTRKVERGPSASAPWPSPWTRAAELCDRGGSRA